MVYVTELKTWDKESMDIFTANSYIVLDKLYSNLGVVMSNSMSTHCQNMIRGDISLLRDKLLSLKGPGALMEYDRSRMLPTCM